MKKEEKRIVVTGASSGVGRELVKKLLHLGHNVVLVGRNERGLEETRQAVPKSIWSRTHLLLADLSQPEQLNSIIDKSEKYFGEKDSIDVLVNNAGVSVSGGIEDIPLQEFDRVWRVNFLAPVTLVKRVLPQMKRRNQGLIVNVTSGVARRALPYESPYCASKAALDSFTDSLRVEIAGTALKVLLFSPGPVSSGFHAARRHFGETKLVAPPFRGRRAEDVADVLIRAMFSQKKRVTLGRKVALVHHLNYWSPSVVDALLSKAFRLESLKNKT